MNIIHRKHTSFHSFYMPNPKTKPQINKHQPIKPKIPQIPTVTTPKTQQNHPKKAQSDQHSNNKKKDLINRRQLHNLTDAAHQWWRRRRPAETSPEAGRRRYEPTARIDLSEDPTATTGAKLAPSASPRLAQPLSPFPSL